MKQLKLSWPAYDPKIESVTERQEKRGYSIEQVVGDTGYKPGDFLTVAHVRDLCEMTGVWKITMVKRAD